MPSIDILLASTCLLGAAYLYLHRSTAHAKAGPRPPGPKPLPILGNVLDLKPKELWLAATEWAKEYGPVTHLTALSIPLIFINTSRAASDLLDTRGALYADKPYFTMAGELCGCSNMVAFTPYGAQSKRQRRLLKKAFAAPVVGRYRPLMMGATRELLGGLMRLGARQTGGKETVGRPEGLFGCIKRYAGSITLSVVYGYEVRAGGGGGGSGEGQGEEEDKFLKLATEAVDILAMEIASGGGVWLVDVFPSLKNIPKWAEYLPFMGFKQKARVWKRKMEEFVDKPWEWCLDSMTHPTHRPSFCSTLLEDNALQTGVDQETKDNFEFDLKWTANSMYGASIDTTLTTLSNLILVLLSHPEIQETAQAEIDRVLSESGSGDGVFSDSERLPGFEDREKLVYCEAVFKEAFRWGVGVPLSLPHRLTQDDVYEGMHLPKGALVFANIWAMMRDPEVFEDPDAFMPERWVERVPLTGVGVEGEGLKVDGDSKTNTTPKTEADAKPEDNVKAPTTSHSHSHWQPRKMSAEQERKMNPKNYVFGFGRRQCPGKELVESSVWLVVVSLLATFTFSPPLSPTGVPMPVKASYNNPIFRLPDEYGLEIRPRSERSVRVLEGLERGV